MGELLVRVVVLSYCVLIVQGGLLMRVVELLGEKIDLGLEVCSRAAVDEGHSAAEPPPGQAPV